MTRGQITVRVTEETYRKAMALRRAGITTAEIARQAIDQAYLIHKRGHRNEGALRPNVAVPRTIRKSTSARIRHRDQNRKP
jgi:hypothetical protein